MLTHTTKWCSRLFTRNHNNVNNVLRCHFTETRTLGCMIFELFEGITPLPYHRCRCEHLIFQYICEQREKIEIVLCLRTPQRFKRQRYFIFSLFQKVFQTLLRLAIRELSCLFVFVHCCINRWRVEKCSVKWILFVKCNIRFSYHCVGEHRWISFYLLFFSPLFAISTIFVP